jgi:hypothetical protein
LSKFLNVESVGQVLVHSTTPPALQLHNDFARALAREDFRSALKFPLRSSRQIRRILAPGSTISRAAIAAGDDDIFEQRVYSQDPDHRAHYAFAKRAIGDREEAARLATILDSEDSSSHSFHFNLGQIFCACGDRVKGRRIWSLPPSTQMMDRKGGRCGNGSLISRRISQ